MSVNEEGVIAGSDSFWELEQYKRTVKRHEDGLKLANELTQLIQERADLEKAYAKSLKSWSQKFGKALESGPEYGTMEAACKGVLGEAERVAELHLTVKDRLVGEIQSSIKTWKNENYTKKLVGPSSGTKELEDLFKKAQKPWAKRFIKAMKAKKDYHTACKLEKTAIHQEGNAKNDSAVSQDQQSDGIAKDTDKIPEKPLTPKERDKKLRKMQDKIDKCKRDVESNREKYKAALDELGSYNRKYTEDMMEVFNRAQDAEEKRLVFFKEMLFGVQKCLDLSDSVEYKQIHHQLLQTISQADYNKDLKWWSQNHGTDMPMNWPNFEEYSPELHDISKKQKKGNVSGGDGIMLTAISSRDNTSPSNQPPPAYENYTSNDVVNNELPNYQRTVTAESSMAGTPPDSNPATPNITPPPSRASMVSLPRTPCDPRRMSYDDALNPFAEDEEDVDVPASAAAKLTATPSKLKEPEVDPVLSFPGAKSPPARPPRPVSLPPPKSPATVTEQKDSYDDSLNPFTNDDDDLAIAIEVPAKEDVRHLGAQKDKAVVKDTEDLNAEDTEANMAGNPTDKKAQSVMLEKGPEVKFRIIEEGEDDDNDISIVEKHVPSHLYDSHNLEMKKNSDALANDKGVGAITVQEISGGATSADLPMDIASVGSNVKTPTKEGLVPPGRPVRTKPAVKTPASNNGGGQNPFGEEEWEEYAAPEIDESKGVPVRALYDYNGQEDDELTFKAGDIFMKLLDADEQGWCTGKKDTKTGLYPNNYVEPF